MLHVERSSRDVLFRTRCALKTESANATLDTRPTITSLVVSIISLIASSNKDSHDLSSVADSKGPFHPIGLRIFFNKSLFRPRVHYVHML